jgi:hypothetical protein
MYSSYILMQMSNPKGFGNKIYDNGRVYGNKNNENLIKIMKKTKFKTLYKK